MRWRPDARVEPGRVRIGDWASMPGEQHGAFDLMGPHGLVLRIISSGVPQRGDPVEDWEHVSVSTSRRTPNWSEMCWVKDLFFAPEEVVVQFHPARSEHVNVHPYCLHLWRWIGGTFPMPPSLAVGPMDLSLPGDRSGPC